MPTGKACTLISWSELPICVTQIMHTRCNSLNGAFRQSQQNEEIQLQPLTGPAYCYL